VIEKHTLALYWIKTQISV